MWKFYPILVLVFIIILYVYPGYINKLTARKSYRLNERYSKAWRIVNFSVLVLSLIAGVLNVWYDLDFRGLWTTRIFVITLLISGVLYAFICSPVRNVVAHLYFKLFSFFPALVALFSLIPFLGIMAIWTYSGKLFVPADRVFYDDNKLRIVTRSHGPLGPEYMDGFRKKGIFEQNLSGLGVGFSCDSVTVKYDADSIHIYSWREGKNKGINSFKE